MAPQVGGSGSLLVPPSERMSLQAFTRALSKRRAAELSSLGIRVAQLPPEEEEQLQDEAAANMELDVETPSERDERLAREEEERILKEGEAEVARLEHEHTTRAQQRQEKLARLRATMSSLEDEQMGLVKRLKEMQKRAEDATNVN
ncbi:hypothetical protein PPROV_000842100 [Pycnococcus provasolii]|uniref:Uncharacterized protein n=1 Tax=Pycnococcus provasolii TaxID=41880 RepID=A0A830HQ95_9CHLO|nr:hypothetical protein PPROV_000842100 [Pycnococcus provasolii]